MSSGKSRDVACAEFHVGAELLQGGLSRATDGRSGSTSGEAERTITVGRSAEALGQLWDDPATRPRVVNELVDDPHVGFREAPRD